MFYLAVKSPITFAPGYRQYMATRASKRGPTRHRISDNVAELMRLRGWSEYDLAKASGVSQKAINNIINRRTAANMDTADALAKPFGLDCWVLLIPNLKKHIAESPSLQQLVRHWISSAPAGQALISHVAEREAEHGNDP
jgi:transcriptional regulator with XRE-family HTH domain